jgi:hypothetical protein
MYVVVCLSNGKYFGKIAIDILIFVCSLMLSLFGVCGEMKRCGKEKGEKRRSEAGNNALVCFFCDSSIEAGEEIILSRNKDYYHRRCYDFLFTLKRRHVVS